MEIHNVSLLLVYLLKKKSFQMTFESASVCQFAQWWRQTIPGCWSGTWTCLQL